MLNLDALKRLEKHIRAAWSQMATHGNKLYKAEIEQMQKDLEEALSELSAFNAEIEKMRKEGL